MENTLVLVCVTRQKTCERLIQAGWEIAKAAKIPLSVVHVERGGANLLGNPSESEALEYLFQVSKSYDADMNVLRQEDVVATLVDFVRKKGVSTVVMGRPPEKDVDNNIIERLKRRLEGVDIRTV